MYSKKTLINYFVQLINTSKECDIRTKIEDKELKLWMRNTEHQFIRDNIDVFYDLFIRKDDQRVIFATVQGNESAVNILAYRVKNDRISQSFSLSLHDHHLAELIHNKRVELTETTIDNTVGDIMNFIEGRGDIL